MPRAQHICLQDTILPTGAGPNSDFPVFVRKGDYVMASTWGLHQDIWGADAAEFRPERWKSFKPVWTFIPFQGDPGTCPAQPMILIQEAYVLVRIVKEFARIENMNLHPWTEPRRIGSRSKYGVKVAFVPAFI